MGSEITSRPLINERGKTPPPFNMLFLGNLKGICGLI